jgi:thioesterase domain-containing protein
MADYYIDEIKKVQRQGPYCLGGSSFGGLVAYEMAVRLRERGDEVGVVALFDTYAPGYPRRLPGTSKLRVELSKVVHRIEHHVESLRMLESENRWPYIVAKAKKARNLLRRSIRNTKRSLTRRALKGLGRSLPEALRETQNAIVLASRSYRPRPYSGVVTLFRAGKQPTGIYPDPTLGWGELVTDRIEIYEVPGTHGTLVVEPRVRLVVEHLERCLEAAELPDQAMAVGY